MTIAKTQNIASNNNWLISLSMVTTLVRRQSSTFFRSLSVSVPGAGRFTYIETPDQECQRQARQHDDCEQVKTIHEREHPRLLVHHASDHPVGLMDGVGSARATRDQEDAPG